MRQMLMATNVGCNGRAKYFDLFKKQKSEQPAAENSSVISIGEKVLNSLETPVPENRQFWRRFPLILLAAGT